MDSRIVDELEAAFGEELALLEEDLGALELAVEEKLRQLGRGLLQRLLQRQRHGYQGSSMACECGAWRRFVGHRRREVHTLLGWVQIPRAYYHCASCGQSAVPYDRSSGLGAEQLSPALAKACCLLSTGDSFGQTSRKLKELFGQQVSANTIERMVQHVGGVILGQQDQALQEFFQHRNPPAAETHPQRLYVAADGTMVHETDGWHEAKLGAIYWEDEGLQRRTRFVGGFENSETFAWHLWHSACRWGLRQAQEVIFLGDGAPWIRHEWGRHFGRATFIIDWYHASGHVWECGKALFGEGSKATEQWSKEHESWLWQGQTGRLSDDLCQQMKARRGAKREALVQLHRYIEENQEAMRYDVFRAQGYDIGSGAVEGACKHVVGKRLKQSGMIWTRVGSSAVLALRLTWLNRDWEQLWSRKPLAA